ncbi:MAG: gluconate 2-dehydrogenase subunit 3 family protein [Acidobacteria bacterium]|nr:gluconate 2-dehydrogenase subunit 3 family protein [Acidobacteriota bacterium]
MSSEDHNDRRAFSRRALLTRAVLFGAGAIVPAELLVRGGPAGAAPAAAGAIQAAAAREPLETLMAAEAATLDAIAARLIPSDGNGPGAAEARATRYIDRALGGALADSREAYRTGLAAVDAYARASTGRPFAELPTADQDAILIQMESNVAAGFTPDAATFFDLVRAHVIQGTFCDPYYGGNANFAGWDLIGYPGIRLAVAPDDQRMDRRPARVRRSAYDHAMFSKKRPARARLGRTDEPWRSS